MNLASVFLKMTDRARADTAAGGLFASGTPLINAIYPMKPPTSEELSFPYVVVGAGVDEAGQTTFTGEGAIATVEFHIFVSTTGTEPLKRLSDIERRLFGNTSGGAAPSVGFQRWTPSTDGTWTFAPMAFQGTRFEGEADPIYHIVQTYSLKGSA